MTIASAIENARNKIATAYQTVENMGGTLPTTQNLENLPIAIESVNTTGSLIDGSVVEIDTNVTSIRSYAFANCTNLNKVILRSNAVVDLSDDTIFENTPIASGEGNIYVPDGLVNDYNANYSNYDINNFVQATYNTNLGSNNWASLAYDGTKFVALSRTGYISTSTDGANWTTPVLDTNLGSNNWEALAYDGTKFVALSRTGYISTSTNGTTWTQAIQKAELGDNYWTFLAPDYTKFVVLGATGYVSYSLPKYNFLPISQLPTQ